MNNVIKQIYMRMFKSICIAIYWKYYYNMDMDKRQQFIRFLNDYIQREATEL